MNEPLDEQLEQIVHEFSTEGLSPEDIAHLVSRRRAYHDIRRSTEWHERVYAVSLIQASIRQVLHHSTEIDELDP